MPNTGKPSKDCHLCRSRRVKCDLGRPSCHRCIKYGVPCPGYREQQDLVFRNANPAIIKKRRKRTNQRLDSGSTLPSAYSETNSLDGAPAGLVPRTGSPCDVPQSMSGADLAPVSGHELAMLPSMSRPVFEHWSNHSIPILLDTYSTVKFLQQMYSTGPQDGPLVWVAHIFSRTYITNVSNPTAIGHGSLADSRGEMAVYMGKALRAVSTALQSPEGTFRDDILATIWVLANYELLVGSLGHTTVLSPWHLHARGLYSILQTRRVENLRSEAGRTVFWSAYNIVQIEAIISNHECPPEGSHWLSIMARDQLPYESLAIFVGHFMITAACTQKRMMDLMRSKDCATAAAECIALIHSLFSAEREADANIASLPADYDQLEKYWLSCHHAAFVKSYHITHLFLNFLSHYPACPIPLHQLEAHRDHCLRTVRVSADQIVELNGTDLWQSRKKSTRLPSDVFNALRMVWPLTAVYAMPSTLPEQKAWAEQSLLFIGRELGVRQALKTYPGTVSTRLPPEAHMPLGFGEPENVEWVGHLR